MTPFDWLQARVDAARECVRSMCHYVLARPECARATVLVPLEEVAAHVEEIGSAVAVLRKREKRGQYPVAPAADVPVSLQDPLEHVPDACFVTDRTGAIRVANRAAEELVGISRHALRGWPLVACVAWRDRELFARFLARLGADPEAGPEEWEVGIARPGEAPIPVGVRARASADDGGGAQAVHWLLRDLRPRRRVETAGLAALAAGMAEQFDRIGSDITAGLEIILHDPGLRDETREEARSFLREAQRAARMAHLLGTSTEGRAAGRIAGSLNALVRDALAELQPVIAQGAIEVERHLSTALPSVEMEIFQLSHVVVELLSNALGAMDGLPMRRLEVTTGTQGRQVFLLIADTGCGIPGDQVAQLLAPAGGGAGAGAGDGKGNGAGGAHGAGNGSGAAAGVPTDAPTARLRRGGLGLAVCRRIVQNHGGEITLHSEPGAGTTCSVLLPVAGEAPAAGLTARRERGEPEEEEKEEKEAAAAARHQEVGHAVAGS